MLTTEHTIAATEREFFELARQCLAESRPGQKCALAKALPDTVRAVPAAFAQPVEPGRPPRPVLVDPRELPRRQLATRAGHGAFVHAICHIEFTAINLALDAIGRFPGMPAAYYADWAGVAKEEAVHYTLLTGHLRTLGYDYGDFPAHGGLWDMALRTGDDILRRMALVPRVMEARGLDVTPGMIARLTEIGDMAGARILERILADEIGHVRIGSRWFTAVCRGRGLDPENAFVDLVRAELGAVRGGKLNRDARLAAGFSAGEIERLAAPR